MVCSTRSLRRDDLGAAAPVAAELLEVGQRLKVFHAIEEQHAVEMIGFVLDDAGSEILRRELEPFPPPIERADDDLARARHLAPDVRDAQTAFQSSTISGLSIVISGLITAIRGTRSCP